MDTSRERTAPAGDADPDLLVVGGDRGGESAPWTTTNEPEGDVQSPAVYGRRDRSCSAQIVERNGITYSHQWRSP